MVMPQQPTTTNAVVVDDSDGEFTLVTSRRRRHAAVPAPTTATATSSTDDSRLPACVANWVKSWSRLWSLRSEPQSGSGSAPTSSVEKRVDPQTNVAHGKIIRLALRWFERARSRRGSVFKMPTETVYEFSNNVRTVRYTVDNRTLSTRENIIAWGPASRTAVDRLCLRLASRRHYGTSVVDTPTIASVPSPEQLREAEEKNGEYDENGENGEYDENDEEPDDVAVLDIGVVTRRALHGVGAWLTMNR